MSSTTHTRRRFLASTALSLALTLGAGCVAPVARQPQERGPAAGGQHTSMPGGRMGPHGPSGAQPHAPVQHGTMMGPNGPQSQGTGTTFQAWFADVENYTGVVDFTGQSQVTVLVGAPGNGGDFAYDPPAIRISAGTRVRWEWTGRGGTHDVVFVDGSRSSRLLDGADAVFERQFTRRGTHLYYCTPHRALGMKGAVIVE